MATNIFNDISSELDGTDRKKSWNSIVQLELEKMIKTYGVDSGTSNVLETWHRRVTTDYKYDAKFSPHVSGFYMIFMVHGPWYQAYQNLRPGDEHYDLSAKSTSDVNLPLNPQSRYFSMLATDIDVPDLTEEYTSVSSRLRNSYVPSRSYFVSDFSISYIESQNLDVMRYHEAWHKYMNLLRRGEVTVANERSRSGGQSYFVDIPYSNAVWVAVYRPFTSDIQLLIKLIGVMPVTMPLKQVVGNRSASKMTVLNLSYKSADIFYKFYDDTNAFLKDTGELAESFRREVLTSS